MYLYTTPQCRVWVHRLMLLSKGKDDLIVWSELFSVILQKKVFD